MYVSLSGIFDPIVWAHFKNKYGGSGGDVSAVDDGFYFYQAPYFNDFWANREDLDNIDVGVSAGAEAGQMVLYKISRAVYNDTQIYGATAKLQITPAEGASTTHEQILDETNTVIGSGFAATILMGQLPMIISGVAGSYSLTIEVEEEGFIFTYEFTIPSDGTYWLYSTAGELMMATTTFYKAATE